MDGFQRDAHPSGHAVVAMRKSQFLLEQSSIVVVAKNDASFM